ncbi:hypothetical protein LJC49_07375 [Ruminococcaceae bacterium OttesenSCG-928-I18]|nr:hypothetical protein [Ruminococcaceae bacterium OttesenSCG-928-I18]
MKEQVNELMKDKTFLEALLQKSNAGEVRDAFATKGVDLSEDLLGELWSRVEEMKKGMLSEEDLSSVAGGARHHSVPM